MPFLVSCPGCRYQFRVPDHVAGQRGKCPKCKAIFVAERSGDAETAPAEANPTAASAATTPTPPPAPPPANVSPPPPPTPPPAPAAPPRSAPPKAPPPAPRFEVDIPATAGVASGAAYAQRRKNKSKLPLIVAVVVVGLFAVGGAAAGVAWRWFPSTSDVAQRDAQESRDSAATSDDIQAEIGALAPAGDEPIDLPPLDNWEALRAALATITVASVDGTREGTGVLVAGGFVLTDSQLLDSAAGAVVSLRDGRKFEVDGAIQRPRHSLALLRLDEIEGELPALELALASPAPQSTIYIADAQAALPTTILRRIDVGALPATLRLRLPEMVRENDELALIEHAGPTRPPLGERLAAAQRGAALLDEQGQLVGLQLDVGGDSRKGYGVGVEELAELVEASAREDFRPLRIESIADGSGFDFPATEPPPETPSIPPPTSERPAEALLAKLKELAVQLGEKDWFPTTADDYAAFGEFASSVTTAAVMFDKLEGAEKEERQAQLVEILEPLASARWPSYEQMGELSKLAVPAALASTTASPGVFVYAECNMRPENLGEGQINGVPIYGFQVVHSDEALIIPVATGGDEITMGSEWLILGQKRGDAELSSSDGTKHHASIVHVKYMLKRPKP